MAFKITAFHLLSLEKRSEYVFDRYDMCYAVKGTPCGLELPYVPQTEIMKAFVKAQNNRRIDSFFADLGDEHYTGMFYNVFDSGEYERMADYDRFELRYLLERLEKWLDENGIPHYTDHEDERLKGVL